MNAGVQALLAIGGTVLLIAVGTMTPLGAVVLLMAMIPFVLIARFPAPDRSPSPKPADDPASPWFQIGGLLPHPARNDSNPPAGTDDSDHKRADPRS